MLVVLFCSACSVVGGWWYFRHLAVTRPPFGVVNLRDVAVAMTAFALLPHIYRSIPIIVVAVVLAVFTLAGLLVVLEPLVRGATRWAVCLALVGADVGIGLAAGVTSEVFLVVNDAVVVLMVIGIANLWAQGGLRARHLAVFAAALTVYDIVVTWQFTIMFDLFVDLSRLPLFPMAAWALDDVQHSTLLGVGDLLMATLAPLVLRRAYGRTAGLVALACGLGTLTAVLVLLATGLIGHTIPVMVFLGPVTVVQYLYWHLTRGDERTTRQYLLAEPLAHRAISTVAEGR
ncbi:hypothetical protein AB0H83_45240 [Dactylosporangium sp. NPDC050688]|uniref:hypothetical protein n=1 Tax=Dactylosporangium sp. NPDC050688 TaxID=3157217 RepID=UPI0033F018F6